jgi:hypothetical protein
MFFIKRRFKNPIINRRRVQKRFRNMLINLEVLLKLLLNFT